MSNVWKIYRFQPFDGYRSFVYVWTENGVVKHQRTVSDLGLQPVSFEDIRGQELKIWNQNEDFKKVISKLTQEQISKGWL